MISSLDILSGETYVIIHKPGSEKPFWIQIVGDDPNMFGKGKTLDEAVFEAMRRRFVLSLIKKFV